MKAMLGEMVLLKATNQSKAQFHQSPLILVVLQQSGIGLNITMILAIKKELKKRESEILI
jgi:hypothetical protein